MQDCQEGTQARRSQVQVDDMHPLEACQQEHVHALLPHQVVEEARREELSE